MHEEGTQAEPQTVDTIITNVMVVTMNEQREIYTDGAIAIDGPLIVGVGRREDVAAAFAARSTIDGRGGCAVPGLVNAHIHITGEPLTKGVVPDDTDRESNVYEWLCPLYAGYEARDEKVSAQLAAVEMLRSGTTSFLEAGTIYYLDDVFEGLAETGVRARLGRWVWDGPAQPEKYAQTTDEAIDNLETYLARYRGAPDDLLQAWPMVVGGPRVSDALWLAAADLSKRYDAVLNFHMSPAPTDPAAYLRDRGNRPFVHLEQLGVLDRPYVAVHCVHIDDDEVAAIARTPGTIVHCPTTALKVAYGASTVSKFPELEAAGVNLALGTDGNNASNHSDIYKATYVLAGLFKDARQDPNQFPATRAFEIATLGGAYAMGARDTIGSIEPGKRADVVIHDTDRPEWVPLFNVVNHLVYSVDGRSVRTVLVDGKTVVDDFHMTTIDEEKLYAEAQRLGAGVLERTNLGSRLTWPVIA